MILSKTDIARILRPISGAARFDDSDYLKARAIESAVLAKLREQTPVAWGNQREDPFDSSQWLITYDKPNRREVKPLYLHPMPKDKP